MEREYKIMNDAIRHAKKAKQYFFDWIKGKGTVNKESNSCPKIEREGKSKENV